MNFRREDLEALCGRNLRLLRAFESQATAVEKATNGVADTSALKDATVIVLSANGDFTNERVLEVGDGIKVEITADQVKLSLDDVARSSDHRVTLVPPADVTLFLPPDGTLLSDTSPISAPQLTDLGNYANDAAAAAGGVPVGKMYRNGSVLMVRVV